MRKVADNESMSISIVALNSNAVTAGATVGIQRCDIVHAHVDLVVDDLVKALGLSLALGDIVYKTSCRVVDLHRDELSNI